MRTLVSVLSLIGPPDDADNSVTLNQAQDAICSSESEPNTMGGNKFKQWMSVTSATAKLFLRGVKESADAFPPLKSVVGGLCFIVDNFEVWQPSSTHYPQYLQEPQQTNANSRAIKSLAPRVTALFGSLCQPVPEGDVKEMTRRRELQE